jgi:hypothetical protein
MTAGSTTRPSPGQQAHHAPGEAVTECLEQHEVREHAEAGRLRDDHVAHQQRGNDGREELVHRVVEGRDAEHHAECSAVGSREVLLAPRGAELHREVARTKPLELDDGVANVVDAAGHLVARRGPRLADLPHEQRGDLLGLRLDGDRKALDRRDARLDMP